MPYDSRAVANYILELAKSDGNRPVSPMMLIKLVYLAHGWHLAIADEPLIDEYPEAWKYGPVIPSLYHQFKHFGSGPITQPAGRMCPDVDGPGSHRWVPYQLPSSVPAQTKEVMDAVWDEYKRFSAVQLSAMTHQPDTPWHKVFNAHPNRRGTDIPDEEIKAHFAALRANRG